MIATVQRDWLVKQFKTKKMSTDTVEINPLITAAEKNELFPVFLKLDGLHTLVVGGGNVAKEKLTALLSNSPLAEITVVTAELQPALQAFLEKQSNVTVERKWFESSDLVGVNLVIAAVNDRVTSQYIVSQARERSIPVNVADTPDLCDFYLGSVVQKGQVKVAISTNGYSPTLAKRMKSYFDEVLPNELSETAENLRLIRQGINGTFKEKVIKLNEITRHLLAEPQTLKRPKIKPVIIWALGIIGLMLLGHLFFSLVSPAAIGSTVYQSFTQVDNTILLVVLGGFVAQLIDGCLSMAYGVTANTVLMSVGIPPAAASASVHASEIFTSGVSGLMHLRFGNVNNKLFKTLLIPGVVGAILGAYVLSSLADYLFWLKPIVAAYTAFLGVLIIRKVIRKNKKRKPLKRVGWLATAGGFLDSVGGGGWGPIVASTLIARGRHPMYTVGSVCVAEFFVSLASSITFITLIGIGHWQLIAGLVLGGVIAAPIAAYFSSRVPVKTLMLVVGIAVIIISLRTLGKTSGLF